MRRITITVEADDDKALVPLLGLATSADVENLRTEVSLLRAAIDAQAITLEKFQEAVMTEYKDIENAVTEETDAISATENLIDSLVAAVKSNRTDPAALDALLAKVQSNRARLVAKTFENTPVPAPPPPPVV